MILRTRSRRVNAVKQLICDDIGPIGCPNKKEYLFETATCINEGVSERQFRVCRNGIHAHAGCSFLLRHKYSSVNACFFVGH